MVLLEGEYCTSSILNFHVIFAKQCSWKKHTLWQNLQIAIVCHLILKNALLMRFWTNYYFASESLLWPLVKSTYLFRFVSCSKKEQYFYNINGSFTWTRLSTGIFTKVTVKKWIHKKNIGNTFIVVIWTCTRRKLHIHFWCNICSLTVGLAVNQ